jgi:hypothetical protein
MTQKSAHWELEPQIEPDLQMLPSPLVHADSAAAAALAAANEQRAAAMVQVRRAQCQRLVNTQPRAPEHDGHSAQPTPVGTLAGGVHDGDNLLHGWCVGGVTHALVPAATVPHGIRASSPANDDDEQHRAATRS